MLADFRYACRQLLGAPGFTFVAVTILALGIGANSAVFNLIHSLLFTPPAYADPGDVYRLYSQNLKKPEQLRDFSYPTYLDVRDRNAVFSSVLAYNVMAVGVGEKGQARRAVAETVTANYFSTLGVAPSQGRAFRPEEETPRRGTAVAVISSDFWTRAGMAPGGLGSKLLVNGITFTVIGVMPKGFSGPPNLVATDLWLPLGVYDQVAAPNLADKSSILSSRQAAVLRVLGRLKPGESRLAAAAELPTLAASLEKAFPTEQKDQGFTLEPPSLFASSANDRSAESFGALLLGMSAVVLLVACLNLANMLRARGFARRKEIATRLALGASRARIVRQLLVEGVVLSLVGGIGGVILALWSSGLFVEIVSRVLPFSLTWVPKADPSLFEATLAYCLLSSLFFALGPALKLTETDLVADLRSHAGEDPVRRRRGTLWPRNPLVSIQIALSLALLMASALFVRGAAKAASIDTGLNLASDLLLEVDGSLAGYDQAHSERLFRDIRERLAALAPVEAVSIATNVPLSGIDLQKAVKSTGGMKERTIDAKCNGVDSDYFGTVGLKLLQGRSFSRDEAARSSGAAVAVINQELARRFWPAGDAVGNYLAIAPNRQPGGPSAAGDPAPGDSVLVVGIVAPTRHTLFGTKFDPEIYLPFARAFQAHVFFHVRLRSGGGAGTDSAKLVRQAMEELDPDIPILSLRSFAEYLNNNIQLWIVRAGAALISTLGFLTLILAMVGIYGVMSYAVMRRTREIGIRMALGAEPRAVQGMVLREGAVMLAVGLIFGSIMALVVARLMRSMLYEVSAFDPLAFGVALGGMCLATFLACWLPARQAVKVDPIVALRGR